MKRKISGSVDMFRAVVRANGTLSSEASFIVHSYCNVLSCADAVLSGSVLYSTVLNCAVRHFNCTVLERDLRELLGRSGPAISPYVFNIFSSCGG